MKDMKKMSLLRFNQKLIEPAKFKMIKEDKYYNWDGKGYPHI